MLLVLVLGGGLAYAAAPAKPASPDDMIEAFYDGRTLNPVWVRGAGSFQPRVNAVLDLLKESWTHGLNPARYNIEKIEEGLADLGFFNRMALDRLVTKSALAYAHDMTRMRGERAGADRDWKFWRAPLTQEDILRQIGESNDPVAYLTRFEPNSNLYRALRTELVRFAGLRKGDAPPIKITGLLKPGQSYPEIPAIRARLGLPALARNPQFYDEALAVEIIKIQREAGLETDGVIGAQTAAILNIRPRDRMEQIIANMERLRWMGDERPARYVIVNIPSTTLWAVENGKPALSMPVIVGKTARPTYSFKTDITGVRFNPTWTVPSTIKKEDFLPMLKEHPFALAERGIRILYKGAEVDPAKVDWATVKEADMDLVRLVQMPGAENPLGRIRIIMDNPYQIYLHDTNNPSLFDKKERELSSGCIRVKEPEKLAMFILQGNEGWSRERMESILAAGKLRDITAETPMPVYITYQTVWLDEKGSLVYGQDIYGLDRKMIENLKKSNSIHIPDGILKTPEKAQNSQ